MPGPSRLWSSFSAAAAAAYRSVSFTGCRERLVDREIRKASFLSGTRACDALRLPASISESLLLPSFTRLTISSLSTSEKSLNSSSFSGWRGASEQGEWRKRVVGFSHLPSQSNSGVSGRGLYCPNSSSSGTTGVLLYGHRFASASTSYAAKPMRRREQAETKANVRSPRSHFKSRPAGAAVARKVRPAFRGALSSIKGLQSEKASGNSRPGFTKNSRPGSRPGFTKNSVVRGGDPRKRNVKSSSPSLSKPGRALPSPPRKSAMGFRFKDRPADEGGKVKRKRKRIKPCPKDVTYKRGMDSDTIAVVSNTTQKGSTPEKTPSLNAQFRQIQPSRELLAHIEENVGAMPTSDAAGPRFYTLSWTQEYLGRRRLAEWRRGGYDPKRTAPLDDLPDGKTKRNPIEETIFKHKLTFVAAAKQVASLPDLQYPEIAFAGRSNVGKSSLINALTRRWGSARTSEKPGLTQSINFFTLGSQLCLVDLPGYGFAYAKEQKKEDWEELVKYFVQTRSNLKRVCLLVDAKWGLKPRDEELLHLMESAGTRFQVVVTKTDVMPPVDLARQATQILKILENYRGLVRPLMMVSSKTGAGLQLFRQSLTSVASGQSRILQEDSF